MKSSVHVSERREQFFVHLLHFMFDREAAHQCDQCTRGYFKKEDLIRHIGNRHTLNGERDYLSASFVFDRELYSTNTSCMRWLSKRTFYKCFFRTAHPETGRDLHTDSNVSKA